MQQVCKKSAHIVWESVYSSYGSIWKVHCSVTDGNLKKHGAGVSPKQQAREA